MQISKYRKEDIHNMYDNSICLTTDSKISKNPNTPYIVRVLNWCKTYKISIRPKTTLQDMIIALAIDYGIISLHTL